MSYFYRFLEDASPKFAQTLYELENSIYTDPRSMLTHSRSFIEVLMKQVMIYESMPNEPYLTIMERIQDLDYNDLITTEVKNALHEVRKLGNVAAHDTRKFRYSESLQAWENLYVIVKWFVEVYHSYEIEVPEYIDPLIEKEDSFGLDEIATKFQKMEELIKQSLKNEQPESRDVESTRIQAKEKQETEIKNTYHENDTYTEQVCQTSSSTIDEAPDSKVDTTKTEKNESKNGEREQLWEELNILNQNEEQSLSYDEVNRFIVDNPSKFVAFLDGVFLRLSFDRMNSLSEHYQTEKLSDAYFRMDSMKLGWKEIHLKLNGTGAEYEAAQAFCKISEEKFKRNLLAEEARAALDNLLDIVANWRLDKEEFVNQDDETQLESATTTEKVKEPEPHMEQEKNEQHQTFMPRLDVLRTSSQESVVHADSFGCFREYMHVKRPIQQAFESVLEDVKQKEEPQLILLCGSVGDGKSHLLAYMKSKKPELIGGVVIHNDSTESFNPQENSLDTLEHILKYFDDEQDRQKAQHTVIAINLGVLHNFYTRQRKNGRFTELCNFINQSGVFESAKTAVEAQSSFHILNFAEEQPYLLTENGAESPFFMDLMDKVTKPTNDNPFYKAWKFDVEQGYQTIAHENYRLLQNKTVQKSIVQSLIESIVKQKIFISTRTFYNFLYEIIVPVSLDLGSLETEFHVKDMLPNLMYAHPERSNLLEALHQIDPIKVRTKKIDRFNSDFVLSVSPQQFVCDNLGEEALVGAWRNIEKRFDTEQKEYIRLLIRHNELMQKKSTDESYREFIWYLYSYYRGDGGELGELFDLVRDVIFKWKGSPKRDYIYINSLTDTFRLAVEIQIEREIDTATFGSANMEEVSRFTPSIRLGFSQQEQIFLFELDYQLYILLKQISKGYRPSWQELQDALQFSELHDQLIESVDKTKEILIVHGEDKGMLKVKQQSRFEKTKFFVEKVHERGI